MKTVEVTKIPFPNTILRGDWYGIVYSILTEEMTMEEHHEATDIESENLYDEFDKNHHNSVSLRFVKKETVHRDDRFGVILSLVQFRVRDSY